VLVALVVPFVAALLAVCALLRSVSMHDFTAFARYRVASECHCRLVWMDPMGCE
jgi:undecaprenyl pyrophosphate phosphatase UppP